jgi:hypothetical protein
LLVKYAGKDQQPSDNLFLSGIPNGLDVEAFKQMFTDMGFTVQQARIINDTLGTGFSAGMVRLGDLAEAAACIEHLHGQTINLPVSQSGGGGSSWSGSSWNAQSSQKGKGSGSLWGAPPGKAWDSGGWGKGCKNGKGGKDGKGWDSGWNDKGTKGFGKAPPGFGKASAGFGKAGAEFGKAGAGFGKSVAGKSRATEAPLEVVYNGKDHIPSDNLYIKNLPGALDKDSLAELFSQQGFTVQRSRIIQDNTTGAAFAAMVQVGSQQEAEMAILQLNGKHIDLGKEVKPLRLKFSGREEPPTPSENLFISGVPSSMDDATLTQLFLQQGFTVQRAKIIPDQWGTGFSAAMVSLGSIEEAQSAINTLSGQVIDLSGALGAGGGGAAPEAIADVAAWNGGASQDAAMNWEGQ